MEQEKFSKLSWEEILERIHDPKCRWHYVTALRGPDDERCYKLKEVCTAFIRGHTKYGYGTQSSLHSVICSSPENLVRYLSEFTLSSHYIYHMCDGLNAIEHSFTGAVSDYAKQLRLLLTYIQVGQKADAVECAKKLQAIINQDKKKAQELTGHHPKIWRI